MLLHVSVLGPSSGTHIVLAKVTLQKVTLISPAGHSSQHNITQHGMLSQYPTGTAKLTVDTLKYMQILTVFPYKGIIQYVH